MARWRADGGTKPEEPGPVWGVGSCGRGQAGAGTHGNRNCVLSTNNWNERYFKIWWKKLINNLFARNYITWSKKQIVCQPYFRSHDQNWFACCKCFSCEGVTKKLTFCRRSWCTHYFSTPCRRFTLICTDVLERYSQFWQSVAWEVEFLTLY